MALSYCSQNGLRQCYKCKNKEDAMLVPDSDPGHNFPTISWSWQQVMWQKRVPLSYKFGKP